MSPEPSHVWRCQVWFFYDRSRSELQVIPGMRWWPPSRLRHVGALNTGQWRSVPHTVTLQSNYPPNTYMCGHDRKWPLMFRLTTDWFWPVLMRLEVAWSCAVLGGLGGEPGALINEASTCSSTDTQTRTETMCTPYTRSQPQVTISGEP